MYIIVNIRDNETMELNRANSFESACKRGMEILSDILKEYDNFSESEIDYAWEEAVDTGEYVFVEDWVHFTITRKDNSEYFEIKYFNETEPEEVVSYVCEVYNVEKIPICK